MCTDKELNLLFEILPVVCGWDETSEVAVIQKVYVANMHIDKEIIQNCTYLPIYELEEQWPRSNLGMGHLKCSFHKLYSVSGGTKKLLSWLLGMLSGLGAIWD